eukprot:snap_masked-scaffold1455_size40601-processed-gene-0.8 protein:Tk02966 transcript:snap_masked-scaffold1455_size40601-processed-gene-0.8-mRNA-1 annotation:"protein n-terminal glutamine amidohydrolase-like isoform x1"
MMPTWDDCEYTKCYCEENVWKLCEHLRATSPERLSSTFAVFVTNESGIIPLWHQRSSEVPDGLVFWDYHVILVTIEDAEALVYDLDTTLSYPCPLSRYYSQAIRSEDHFVPKYQRKFRVVPAPHFLDHFASDRKHMQAEDGKWQAPPPNYPPIATRESTHNLHDYLNMAQNHPRFGHCVDLVGFGRFFGLSIGPFANGPRGGECGWITSGKEDFG